MITLPEEIFASSILIVDDSPTNVLLLKKILEKGGYKNVGTTTDSREVRGLVEAGGCDLILLDIRMPNLDGYQVMEEIQAMKLEAPPTVLVLTAELNSEVFEKALCAGAKDVLSKPCDRVEALNRIHNTLETRLLCKQLAALT